MKRAIIIVLDSVGIGALPDASKYGDEGSNTLVNIKKKVPDMHLPNLCNLGLGNIEGEETYLLGATENPQGSFGKMAEKSSGKDTTTGHWEIGGIITKTPFPTFTQTGFPAAFMEQFEKAIGRKTLGNVAASGTEIINQLGEKHMRTGYPIIYTSADSVFQIAAHEEIMPVEALYQICETARQMLTGDLGVARVIARPFHTEAGSFKRTSNRRDFSLAPTSPTILDLIKEQGLSVAGIGKIGDIFCDRGTTSSVHTVNNADTIYKTIEEIKKGSQGLVFSNLVDYDMIYGHRNDVQGYAKALVSFDKALPALLEALKKEDILFITADHGCDPTTPSTDHSREYVPLLIAGKQVKKGVNLGVRDSFSDLGATICEYLNVPYRFAAKSFLQSLL